MSLNHSLTPVASTDQPMKAKKNVCHFLLLFFIAYRFILAGYRRVWATDCSIFYAHNIYTFL